MTLDTATTQAPTEPPLRTPNGAVIDQIRAHHHELARQLHEHTWAVLAAAEQGGDCAAPRDTLREWYRSDLMPHVVAEEQALYSAGTDLDATRLLVCGMLAEHRTLVSLVADLALTEKPLETALIAASAEVLFSAHLEKENDLLLPALDAAGLDLGVLLDGMHEILGAATAHSAEDGCGCNCGHAGHGEPVPVAIKTAPDFEPLSGPSLAAGVDATGELDVRTLPHGQRHEIIFSRLDALAPGQALVIVNDHDPKPLRYQTEALWPGRFTWTYREAGPQVWRLAIARDD